MGRHDLGHPAPHHPDPGFRILSLVTGGVLAVLLLLFPRVALNRWGEADPLAAGLLLWAMSAGFASGLGLAPAPRAARGLLSSGACLLALVLSVIQIVTH
jgi:predicted membrane protein